MPEAITYRDMARRIAAAVPQPASFKLIVHRRNFGAGSLKGYDNWLSLTEGKSWVIRIDGTKVLHHGKTLLIPIFQFEPTEPRSDGYRQQTVWVKIALALHGHVLPITAYEARELADPSKSDPPYALLIFQSVDPTGQSIALIDRNRLASAEFLAIWTDLNPKVLRTEGPSFPRVVRGFCTMSQWDQWSAFILGNTAQWQQLSKAGNTSIFAFMVDNQDWFEGIGTSHCSEILHIAEEHPATLAQVIMQSPQRLNRLCNAVKAFYDKARSPDYLRRVPARSGGSAFYESLGTTRYINEMFHQVYGKTIAGVLIPVERYDRMVQNRQLDPCYQLSTTMVGNRQPRIPQKKRVKVYAIKLRSRRGIAYTCIYLPLPVTNAEIIKQPLVLSREEAIRSQTGRAEMGIASFVDTKAIEAQERYSTYRRFPFHTGAVGRPRLTKRLHKVQSGTVGSIRGKVHQLGKAPAEYKATPERPLDREDNELVELAPGDNDEGVLEFKDPRGGGIETVVARGVLSGLSTALEEDAEGDDDDDTEE